MASCPQGRPSAEGESPVRLRLSAGMNRTLPTRPYAQWLNALKEREAARQTPPLIS